MTIWQKILDAIVAGNISDKLIPPYVRALEMPMISSWGERHVCLDWDVDKKLHQGTGIVFGGYLSALADYAAGSAMLTVIGDRELFLTNGLEIDYKRPVRSGTVHIRAEVVEDADNRVVVEVTFRNERDDLYAVARVAHTRYAP